MNEKNLDLATKRIQTSMAQIVHVTEDKKIEPLGTTIFIDIDGTKRMLSAGHLINTEDYSKLRLPLNGTNEILYIDTFGDLTTTNREAEQEGNEIDFAEITFTKEDIKSKVSDFYSFIANTEIEFNHKLETDDNRYFIFGYPITRTKFNFQTAKEINAQPLRIVTYPITDKEFYEKQGYDIETHILLWIQRKLKTEHERVFIPKTKGISGCGVYFLPDLKNKEDSNEFKLVGILTEIDFERQFATVVGWKQFMTI